VNAKSGFWEATLYTLIHTLTEKLFWMTSKKMSVGTGTS